MGNRPLGVRSGSKRQKTTLSCRALVFCRSAKESMTTPGGLVVCESPVELNPSAILIDWASNTAPRTCFALVYRRLWQQW